MAESNKLGASRINQEGERLLTVRPRYYITDPSKPSRGQVSTFRIVRGVELTDEENNSLMSKMSTFEQKAYSEIIRDGGYHNFILQNIQYTMQEKRQVFHTFGGKESVYLYGQNPVEFRVSGLVTDDLDNDQFVKLVTLYNNHMRGTVAAKNFSLIEMSLPNLTIYGSVLDMSFAQSSDRDTDIQFSMTIIAKHYIFRSTDEFFYDDNDQVKDNIGTNFLTTALYAGQYDEQLATRYSASQSALLTPTTAETEGETESSTNSLQASGIYTKSVETPESVQDILDFLENNKVSDLVDPYLNQLDDALGYVDDVVGIVDDMVGSVVNYLGDIESTLDDVMNTIGDTVGNIRGAIENLEDAWGTIANFPESIANKVGRFLENGFMSPSGVPLTGSNYISASEAEAILKAQARTAPGPVRGSQLDPSNTSSADDVATLTY